jgi:hypothetical protein
MVRSYISKLNVALRGVPTVQARELREQIMAHIDEALPPDADDEQIAVVLGRLGSPAELAADVQASSAPPTALAMIRTSLRYRLAQVPRRAWSFVGVIVAGGLHPIGAEVVEPGVEVKLRLLDALDWQRSPCERGVLAWRGRAKGSCG